MADEIGTKVSQLPLGENLGDSDLMYAVEGGISKKVEVGYLKNRLVGNVDSAPTQGSTNLVQSGGVYTALASKADSSAIPTDLADLADDSTHRTVTDAEKASWDGKADTSDIPTALSDLTDDSTHRVVSDTEKATWNGKSDFSGSFNDLTDKPTIPSDADDIGYDNTESGLTADDVQGAIDEVNGNIVDVEANPSGTATGKLGKIKVGSTIYNIAGGEAVYGEASGAIASFSDGSANSLADLKIAINPVQAGSGDPSPSNPRPISGWTGANITRCGKNLYFDKLENASIKADGTFENNNSNDVLIARVNEGDTYTFSCNDSGVTVGGLFTEKPTMSSVTYNQTRLYLSQTTPSTITIPQGVKYIAIRYLKTFTTYMIEKGSSATAYEAYNGTTYPITWQTEAGEVFGGYIDYERKKVVVNLIDYTITSTRDLAQNGEDVISMTIPSEYRADVIPQCEAFEGIISGPSSGLGVNQCRFNNSRTFLNFKFSAPKTVDEWKAELANNPIKLILGLVAPVEYDLDSPLPTITTLLGNNNIWADTGDINYCKYKRDLNICINNIIDQLNS